MKINEGYIGKTVTDAVITVPTVAMIVRDDYKDPEL